MPTIIPIILALLLFTQAHSKTVAAELKMMTFRLEKSWYFLDRMNFAEGEAIVKFQAKLKTETVPARDRYKLTLLIIPQNLWASEVELKCNSLVSSSSVNSEQESVENGTIKKEISFFFNQNQMMNEQTIKIRIFKPITYYFVLADCGKSMVNQYFNKRSILTYQLDTKNNGKNYGNDQQIYNFILPILIGITIFTLNCIKIKNKKTEQPSADINWPVLLVKIIAYSQIIATISFYIAHLIYIVTSHQPTILSYVFLIGTSFSQIILIMLLIFCAFGWMTTYIVQQKQQFFYPIASISIVLHLVMTLLYKVNDGSLHKTHMYDSMAFMAQNIMKAIGFVVFFIGIVRSCSLYPRNKKYLLRLLGFGICCFGFVPFAVYFIERVYEHDRWVPVFLVTQVIRTLQIVVIGFQVSVKNSYFLEFCLHGRSFMEIDRKLL